MTVSVKRDDAIAITLQCAMIRHGVNKPLDAPSWVEEEPGIWVVRLPEPVSVVYYQADGRVEVEVGDFCLGAVTMASIVGGTLTSLVLTVDSGFILSCPVGRDVE